MLVAPRGRAGPHAVPIGARPSASAGGSGARRHRFERLPTGPSGRGVGKVLDNATLATTPQG